MIASATSMAEACSVSQDRGPGFLLEACLEFCQAERASLFFSSSLTLSLGYQWLILNTPSQHPAEKGQLYPAGSPSLR